MQVINLLSSGFSVNDLAPVSKVIVDWVLTGRLSDASIIVDERSPLSASLLFHHRGVVYRITRSLVQKGKNTLEFNYLDDCGWCSLTEPTVRDTQLRIQEVLGDA